MNHSISRDAGTARTPAGDQLPGALPEALRAELGLFRRDLHMHPELGNQEFRTTAALKERLERAGLRPRVLAVGTGLICDIGTPDATADGAALAAAPARPLLALRADIDALPIPDTKTVDYASTIPGRAHACGHDVHTSVVLGAGLVLAELARRRRPAAARPADLPARRGGAAGRRLRRDRVRRPGGRRPDPRRPLRSARRQPAGSGSVRERSPPPVTGWRSGWTAPAATPPVRT